LVCPSRTGTVRGGGASLDIKDLFKTKRNYPNILPQRPQDTKVKYQSKNLLYDEQHFQMNEKTDKPMDRSMHINLLFCVFVPWWLNNYR